MSVPTGPAGPTSSPVITPLGPTGPAQPGYQGPVLPGEWSDRASEHVHYEIWMLHSTRALWEPTLQATPAMNVVVEAFAIHLRNVIDFLCEFSRYTDESLFVDDFLRGAPLDPQTDAATIKARRKTRELNTAWRTGPGRRGVSTWGNGSISVALDRAMSDLYEMACWRVAHLSARRIQPTPKQIGDGYETIRADFETAVVALLREASAASRLSAKFDWTARTLGAFGI